MPANPDSIILRVVQVDALGDSPWDEPISVLTDGFKTGAVFVVETEHDDLSAAMWRDGDNLRLRDVNVSGSGYALSELLTIEHHKELRQLIHFIEDGPAEGFASGAYRETTGTVYPTAVVWYVDSSKTDKIVERLITWTGVNATVDKWKIYDTDGSTVLWTITDNINYTGIFETNRTRTITSGDA